MSTGPAAVIAVTYLTMTHRAEAPLRDRAVAQQPPRAKGAAVAARKGPLHWHRHRARRIQRPQFRRRPPPSPMLLRLLRLQRPILLNHPLHRPLRTRLHRQRPSRQVLPPVPTLHLHQLSRPSLRPPRIPSLLRPPRRPQPERPSGRGLVGTEETDITGMTAMACAGSVRSRSGRTGQSGALGTRVYVSHSRVGVASRYKRGYIRAPRS